MLFLISKELYKLAYPVRTENIEKSLKHGFCAEWISV